MSFLAGFVAGWLCIGALILWLDYRKWCKSGCSLLFGCRVAEESRAAPSRSIDAPDGAQGAG